MGQGEDRGAQYHSVIFTTTPAQAEAARASRDAYQDALVAVGEGAITTAIREATAFYHAEAHHQQYLARHLDASCSVAGTGVACPAGLAPVQ